MQFVKTLFNYHIYVMIPQILSIPLIFLFEGLNYNVIHNQQFLPGLNKYFVEQTVQTMSFSIGFIYYIYIFNTKKDELEAEGYALFSMGDLLHILILIMVRSIVLGVKYGFYSREHLKIYQAISLPYEFTIADRIMFLLNTNDIDIIRKRMEVSMN